MPASRDRGRPDTIPTDGGAAAATPTRSRREAESTRWVGAAAVVVVVEAGSPASVTPTDGREGTGAAMRVCDAPIARREDAIYLPVALVATLLTPTIGTRVVPALGTRAAVRHGIVSLPEVPFTTSTSTSIPTVGKGWGRAVFTGVVAGLLGSGTSPTPADDHIDPPGAP